MRRGSLLVAALAAGLVACAGPRPADRPGQQDPAEINTQLGIGYMRDGKDELALEKFKRALDVDPDLVNAHIGIAVLYERLGEDNKAERHFERAVSLDPKDPRAHTNYGNFLCDAGRPGEAIEQFREAVENPLYDNKAIAWTNAGLCALRSGDRDEEAEGYFRKALQADPESRSALYNMARLSYRNERYLQARGFLQRYREVADHTAASLWLRVRVERALGNDDEASSHAMLLEKNFPDSDEADALLDSEQGDDGG